MHTIGAGGGEGGFEVEPGEVRAIGKQAGRLGQRLVQMARSPVESSGAATQTHGAWAVAGALSRAQQSAERNVEGFGRSVDDVCDRLVATAEEYERSDEWSMSALRGIGV